jgi:drug/metabolite transporter (DMT)-like permease
MAFLGSQLRIRATQPLSVLRDAEPAPPGRGAINLDNILKLIPGEVVPLYITGSGLVVPALGEQGWPVAVFVICLVICLFLRAVASKPVDETGLLRGANLGLVVVSGISFFLWVHAISDGGPLIWALPQSAWGFLAMAFSVVAPVLVKDK